MSDTTAKMEKLTAAMTRAGRVAIAFSGGTDSTFLAATAARVLGTNAVLALTAHSPLFTPEERDEATALCRRIGIRQKTIELDEMTHAAFRANTPDRCYHCKRLRLRLLETVAAGDGFDFLLEGSNLDDLDDIRPGRRALMESSRTRSPLQDAGLTKAEIREQSRRLGLPVWDKPSNACLASRIAFGLEITPKRLAQIATAEKRLRALLNGPLRVRHHGDLARIEIDPVYLERGIDATILGAIHSALNGLGFAFVALDLDGFRSGSMNAAVGPE